MRYWHLVLLFIIVVLIAFSLSYLSLSRLTTASVAVSGSAVYKGLAYNDCNDQCVAMGYSFGGCKNKCSLGEIKTDGKINCTQGRSAEIIVGLKAKETYSDGEAYVGEDKKDPDWIWVVNGLTTVDNSDIFDVTDDLKHYGPIIGIKNTFRAIDIDPDEEFVAKTVGGDFCLPGNFVCIKFNSTNTNDYASYKIQYGGFDLSNCRGNASWNDKSAIQIRSYDDADGLKIKRSGLFDTNLTVDIKTDKLWVTYNGSATFAALCYEDNNDNNLAKLAGTVKLDASGDDFNIAEINYKQTSGDNIAIDLRGDFGTADNLKLALDIKGEEGLVSNENVDDLVIALSHSANGDFDGLGITPSSSEASELLWGSNSTQIGKKDEDHLSLYGIIIEDPDSNGAADTVSLEIPAKQLEAQIVITGALTADVLKSKTFQVLSGGYMSVASEASISGKNLLLLGGPVVNSYTKEILGEWTYKPGEAIVELVDYDGQIALIVAGTEAEDTVRAAKALSDYKKYKFIGSAVLVTEVGDEIVVEQIKKAGKYKLEDYPTFFVKDTNYNILAVYGDEAATEDALAGLDVLRTIIGTKVEVTVSEAITPPQISISEDVPLGNNISDEGFFEWLIEDDDIASLKDYVLTYRGSSYDVHDLVLLYKYGPSIQTSLSSSEDDYRRNPYMELERGRLRYYNSFDDSIDLTKATSDRAVNIEFLGKVLSITSVPDANSFVVQSIAEKYLLDVGDTVIVGGVEVSLVDVDATKRVVVEVNKTKSILQPGENAWINDIQVTNLKTFFHSQQQRCCCFNPLAI